MRRPPSIYTKRHVPLVVLLLERLHVLRNVTTEDVLLQRLVIKLLRLGVVAGETLGVVGDVDTAVAGALEGTEHTRTRRRALETDVKVALERPRGVIIVKSLRQGDRAVRLRHTLVLVCETELCESAAGAEEASRISCHGRQPCIV